MDSSRRASRRVAFHAGIEGLEGRAIPSALMVQAVDLTGQAGTITITPPGSWEPTPTPYPAPGDPSGSTTYPPTSSSMLYDPGASS